MRLFLKWAKLRGVSFKRQRDEKTGFNVWKLCQEEIDRLQDAIDDQKAELSSLVKLLQEINTDIKELKMPIITTKTAGP